MTQVGKAAVLVSTLGAVGGGVAVASGAFNKQETVITISSKLASEGFSLLDTSKDDENWEEVLKVYKTENSKTFTGKQEAEKTKEQLRSDCKKALEKTAETSESYLLASRWCVKKEKISDILTRGKRKLLNFEIAEVKEETAHWEKKIEELKKNKEKFKAVKDEIKDNETEAGSNIKALKAACKALDTGNIETTSNKFKENFELAKEWCSIPTE